MKNRPINLLDEIQSVGESHSYLVIYNCVGEDKYYQILNCESRRYCKNLNDFLTEVRFLNIERLKYSRLIK